MHKNDNNQWDSLEFVRSYNDSVQKSAEEGLSWKRLSNSTVYIYQSVRDTTDHPNGCLRVWGEGKAQCRRIAYIFLYYHDRSADNGYDKVYASQQGFNQHVSEKLIGNDYDFQDIETRVLGYVLSPIDKNGFGRVLPMGCCDKGFGDTVLFTYMSDCHMMLVVRYKSKYEPTIKYLKPNKILEYDRVSINGTQCLNRLAIGSRLARSLFQQVGSLFRKNRHLGSFYTQNVARTHYFVGVHNAR